MFSQKYFKCCSASDLRINFTQGILGPAHWNRIWYAAYLTFDSREIDLFHVISRVQLLYHQRRINLLVLEIKIFLDQYNEILHMKHTDSHSLQPWVFSYSYKMDGRDWSDIEISDKFCVQYLPLLSWYVSWLEYLTLQHSNKEQAIYNLNQNQNCNWEHLNVDSRVFLVKDELLRHHALYCYHQSLRPLQHHLYHPFAQHDDLLSKYDALKWEHRNLQKAQLVKVWKEYHLPVETALGIDVGSR